MFILVYSDNELLSSDNEVSVFKTKVEAYNEMLYQLDGTAADSGLTINICDDGDVFGIDEDDEYLGWVGLVSDNDAYLDYGTHRWAIFEVKE